MNKGMPCQGNSLRLMRFNNCKKWDFMPELSLDGHDIQLEEEMRLLGVMIRSDMKWSSNNELLKRKAQSKAKIEV